MFHGASCVTENSRAMNMTTPQRNKLLTILHLHHVTHGQDVSDLIDVVWSMAGAKSIVPKTELERMMNTDKAAHEARQQIFKIWFAYRHDSDEARAEATKQFIMQQNIPQYPFTTIINAMQKVTGFTRDELSGKSRLRTLGDMRHLAIGLTYIHCLDMVLVNIGKKFSRKHSTILHSVDTMSNLTQTDKRMASIRYEVEKILAGN